MSAGPLEDVAAACLRKDFATALRLVQPLADKGVAYAQYNLGVMYQNGQGVPQNYTEALKWFRLAANQGYGPAQSSLGFMFDAWQPKRSKRSRDGHATHDPSRDSRSAETHP
jgi:uncharacterized protein